MGSKLGVAHSFKTRHEYSNVGDGNGLGNMFVDNQNNFLGFGGSPDELYANSPLLARQYQESIADGGLGCSTGRATTHTK
jgi:hypothetical protein